MMRTPSSITLLATSGLFAGTPEWFVPVRRHNRRVSTLAEQIASRYDLPIEQQHLVTWAALWHDIGKLALGPLLVNKPGPLNSSEWAQMRRHPCIGAAYACRLGAPLDVVRIIAAHHERWDGRGYGSGLEGNQIPIGAQIVSLADVFDALTSDRPYRQALPLVSALEIMDAERERAFHPDLLDIALKICATHATKPCLTA